MRAHLDVRLHGLRLRHELVALLLRRDARAPERGDGLALRALQRRTVRAPPEELV